MFRIDPNTLYTRQDIQRELGDAITVERFLERVSPYKRFKNLYWGKDLIDGINSCSSFDGNNLRLYPSRKEVKRNAKSHPQENRIRLDKVLT